VTTAKSDEERKTRREIERQTIFGEVLERLGSDASEDELVAALAECGYWNKEEEEELLQKEQAKEVEHSLTAAIAAPDGPETCADGDKGEE